MKGHDLEKSGVSNVIHVDFRPWLSVLNDNEDEDLLVDIPIELLLMSLKICTANDNSLQ